MISLKKGETAKITTNQFIVGLGWDTQCDLDAHAYIYNDSFDDRCDVLENKVIEDKKEDNKGFFKKLFGGKDKNTKSKTYHAHYVNHVYYGNLSTDDGSVIHTGDNLTGEGDGDDEQILINLDLIKDNIIRICFKVDIFSGASSFSDIQGAFIRILDKRKGDNQVICQYNLTTAGISDDAYDFEFGNLIREGNSNNWYFKAGAYYEE